MAVRPRTKYPLKCFCRRRPLLAMYGTDSSGRLYIHIKIWKAHRIFGEMFVTDGSTQIRCRECLRWHTVKINQPGVATLEESSPPVDTEEPVSVSLLANPSSEL
jgi:hypothetical protein